MAWTPVCREADLKSGESRAFDLDGTRIAIFNVEGEFFATDDRCTHEEASLSEGFIEDHLVECPLHGSQFDLRSGRVLSLPAVFPVRTYQVRLDDGSISVEVTIGSG